MKKVIKAQMIKVEKLVMKRIIAQFSQHFTLIIFEIFSYFLEINKKI